MTQMIRPRAKPPDSMLETHDVFIFAPGSGGVGSCFLKQLAWLSKQRAVPSSRLCYLATIDGALCHEDCAALDIETALQTLDSRGSALLQLSETIEYLAAAPNRVVLVDNTSSAQIAEAYPKMLQKGISVVTPNEKALSGSYELWQAISSSAETGRSFIYHEASVGAGLPVISTLNDLVSAGDRIARIQGVFSGTMSFLSNSFAPVKGKGGTWSSEVSRARSLGCTEPDPRDDLNGLDVARKLTILGRIAGLPIESPSSFPVQSLISQELEKVGSVDELMRRLPEFDDSMAKRRDEAAAAGKVIRYVGSVDMTTKQARVGLEWFDSSDPVANLRGSDNIISFCTRRHGALPLTVQGAGAGGEVTAMGVLGDLFKVLRQI
ncbi:hypothetical protein LZ31DRAFT_582326 [Colletotrichum somersetense]|nr:hypothetical protein LZ31DRAFT_582326 [Colletotrichum somersetense]